MFRFAVVPIELIFAGAPNAKLLCALWCGPHATPINECHSESSSSVRITDDDPCDSVNFDVVAFVREGVRRIDASSDTNHAIALPRYQIAPLALEATLGRELGRDRLLERRPLEIALRL